MVLSVMGIGRCIILSMFREKRNVASIFEENSTGKEKDPNESMIAWLAGEKEMTVWSIDRALIVDEVISITLYLDTRGQLVIVYIPRFLFQWMNWLLSLTQGKFSLLDGWRDGLWFIFRINEIKGRNKGKILSMVISSFNFIHKNLTVFRSWPCFTR